MRLAGLVFAALSLAVVLFHVAAIFGAPVGHLTMGGRWPGVLPPAARLLSLLSIGITALMVTTVLVRAEVLGGSMPAWSMRVVLAYLATAILAHVATPSSAERKLWLPVILALTAAALWVEMTSSSNRKTGRHEHALPRSVTRLDRALDNGE